MVRIAATASDQPKIAIKVYTYDLPIKGRRMTLPFSTHYPVWRRHFLLLAVMLTSVHATADDSSVLVPHSAYYEVKISVLKGYMLTYLSHEEKMYKATSEVRARGFARMFTNGSITGASLFDVNEFGVQPQTYSGSNTIAKTHEILNLNFDWQSKKLVGSLSETSNGDTSTLPIDETLNLDTHDALSLQYALMHDLANNRLQDQYILAEGDEQKTINIRRLENKTIQVPFGSYDVIPIQHQAESSSRVTTFWCAKELNYLPIMIEQYKGDKRQLLAVLANYRVPPYE